MFVKFVCIPDIRLAAEEVNVDFVSVYGNLFYLFIFFLGSFTDVLFYYVVCCF